jgi:hypothetical protein
MFRRLMNDEMDGSGRDLIEILPRRVPRLTEEYHEKRQTTRCFDRDSNRIRGLPVTDVLTRSAC